LLADEAADERDAPPDFEAKEEAWEAALERLLDTEEAAEIAAAEALEAEWLLDISIRSDTS